MHTLYFSNSKLYFGWCFLYMWTQGSYLYLPSQNCYFKFPLFSTEPFTYLELPVCSDRTYWLFWVLFHYNMAKGMLWMKFSFELKINTFSILFTFLDTPNTLFHQMGNGDYFKKSGRERRESTVDSRDFLALSKSRNIHPSSLCR